MLETMRSFTKSIIIKGLLLAIALSFVVWGVGDIFRGRTSNYVAKVGNVEISYDEYNNMLMRELSRYQQMLGVSLNEEQIQQYNIKRNVLNQIIDGKILLKRIADNKITVGENVVQDTIVSESAFKDETGKFSKERFESILRANHINQNDYIESIKREAAVNMLINAMAVRGAGKGDIAEVIYDYRNQKRIADIITVSSSFGSEAGEPSETDLVQFYNENSRKFVIPEKRDFTYVIFSIDDTAANLEITDEQLEAEYNANKSNYQVDEVRKVDQYLFDNENDAKAAKAAIDAGNGKNFDKNKTDLGELTKEGLPEDVQAPIFSTAKGSASQLVQTQLGWHIFVIKDIIPAHQREFKDVKDDIKKSLRTSRAADLFYENANHFEDELAAGTALEEAAKKFNFKSAKIASINKEGLDESGNKVSSVPSIERLLELAFAADSGTSSPLTLLPDNSTYVIVHVDNVVQERVRALDEVKGSVIKMWKEQQKLNAAEKEAEDVAKKIAEGTEVTDIASKEKLKLERNIELSNSPDETKVPVALIEDLFSLAKGGVTQPYKDKDGNFLVAQLRDIKKDEVKAEKLGALREDISSEFTDEILTQYNTYLRNEYPIVVNETLLKSAE